MGRVAVVTGGASGMGLAICRHLAQQGNSVAVLDLQGEAAAKTAAELSSSGPRAIGVEVDVADKESVDAALGNVRRELGTVSIMVTSAGIAPYDSCLDISLELWRRVIDVNLTGTFLCVQAVIPDMTDAGWGRIVTVSSAAGQWGTARMAHYSAAKGGVIALTKALARELAPCGITVNTVPPGVIDTPMSRHAQAAGNIPDDGIVSTRVPLGRKGTADEIAATCAFLCSEAASYITGQVYAVNGGMVM
ncbi:short-chain dehydrogenase [Mycobacterium mantenii]|uniref:3-oxoacyl-[acyl-carrier-protein] reductase MabA n=1 Tax=Mycobacterium mantenii TaxID=560555 RepID=A0A1X0FLY6_MYCNT|nr:SDR family NAD(P)-dependent oxidoreductase [Mycobacterium mantenii]MCV7246536.1 SDR family oxidoreductase [Mycobacterium mantenii]ORB02827.1 short-chain dehydrogenase [Mycobacterium mantenii]BBY38048.1 short-chain dehydrogenase [Mycobacterium mantenii]